MSSVCVVFHVLYLFLTREIQGIARQVLVKCDVSDGLRLIAVADDDPQPIRTILASLHLPRHVTNAASVLVDGRIVADHDIDGACLDWSHEGLLCVQVQCGRLRGGMENSVDRTQIPLKGKTKLQLGFPCCCC